MTPEALEFQARVVAGARRGDAACLHELHCLVGSSPSRTAPTVFQVDPNGLLYDPLGQMIRKRSDVYRRFVPFAAADPRFEGLTTQAAIQDVRDCPPLAKVFAAAALSHYNRLELRLLGDQGLDAHGQALIRQQLKALAAPGRAVWINWVHMVPAWRHDEFDDLARGWLDQPVDFAEAQWFEPGWQWRGIAWAARAIEDLGPAGRTFLEAQLQDGKHWGLRRCAVLECTVEEANRRAGQLELAIRFAAAPELASAAPTAPTAAATAAAPTAPTAATAATAETAATAAAAPTAATAATAATA